MVSISSSSKLTMTKMTRFESVTRTLEIVDVQIILANEDEKG